MSRLAASGSANWWSIRSVIWALQWMRPLPPPSPKERELKRSVWMLRARMTCSRIADALNLSANYFGDLVKAQTGSSPQQLIQQNIIAQARHHLTTTTDTVSQIAYALGFEYPQYFSRLFKKQTGLTPQEFRAQA